jgi:hypothetical protein
MFRRQSDINYFHTITYPCYKFKVFALIVLSVLVSILLLICLRTVRTVEITL